MSGDIFDKAGPNLLAAMAVYAQQTGADPKSVGWDVFRDGMYKLTNRYPRTDVIPEEAAHVWLEALNKPVPDPTCGRGR